MNLGLRVNATFLIASSLFLGDGACADDNEPTHQLSLADLAKYRAALAGKATADDAKSSDKPVRVSFKDLWNRADALRGRRVILEGRVQRIFRQGPVGSFPALAEIWIASLAGDPFCLVVPQEKGSDPLSVNEHDREGRDARQRIPKQGQTVRFTGTFLKMIRYTAGDGDRLAPLVVGDQPPILVRENATAKGHDSISGDASVGTWALSPATTLLGLTLALLVAGLLAKRHVLLPSRQARLEDQRRRLRYTPAYDPPLEFIEPHDEL